MIIKVLLTIVFLAVMIGVGLYTRKQASSVDGFVLGGRAVGPWLTAFAFGTSYFSAVVFVGYAGQFGWKYGLSSTWIGVGNAVIGSWLAWVLLGRRTKLMTQHIESRTMPDFFGTRYSDQGLRVAASIIAFVFLIPYTAGVYKGISTLFEMGFGIPYEYCVVIMAILTAVYVILGGYKATAMNDFIQGIIMLFGIVAIIVAVLNAQGGFTAAVDKLSLLPSDADPSVNGGFASWFGPDPWGLLGVVVLTSLGTMGLPQMVGKFYSITDESAIKRGTIISTIFAFIVASMSTMASLVLTSSSTMTLDVIYRDKKSLPGEVEDGTIDDIVAEKIERRKVVVMRVLIMFFIAISLLIALNPPTFIAQLMGISWGALAGAFLAPFMLGLYWRGVTTTSVWACFVWGVGLTVVNMLLGNPINPINCGAIAMVGGFPVVFLVSLFTKKMSAKTVDSIFGCYA